MWQPAPAADERRGLAVVGRLALLVVELQRRRIAADADLAVATHQAIVLLERTPDASAPARPVIPHPRGDHALPAGHALPADQREE